MSSTVTYKGNALTTVYNATRKLNTKGKYLEDDITITDVSGGSSPNLQTKSATPTESAQTIEPDTGYDGLSSVEVGAISSTYVGSDITRRASTDLTAWEDWVIVPAGYYEEESGTSVGTIQLATPTATKGTVSNHSVLVTPSITQSYGYTTGGTKSGTAVTVSASELVSGTYTVDSAGTKDVTNYANASVPSSTMIQSSTISGESTITVSNTGYVEAGFSAFEPISPIYTAGWASTTDETTVTVNVSGGIQLPTQAATTITPTTSSQTAVTAGKYTTGAVTVAAMPSGTAGTPTAIKGTVSNHSISVTPSVTNTTGYITGGTKSGTAVTVSASELVSGSQTITDNGTVNVTNLASVTVAVPYVSYYTGSSQPSSSMGSNGDLYFQTE